MLVQEFAQLALQGLTEKHESEGRVGPVDQDATLDELIGDRRDTMSTTCLLLLLLLKLLWSEACQVLVVHVGVHTLSLKSIGVGGTARAVTLGGHRSWGSVIGAWTALAPVMVQREDQVLERKRRGHGGGFGS